MMMCKGSILAASVATISSFLYSFVKYKKIAKNAIIKNLNYRTTKNILKELYSILIPISLTSILIILENNIDLVTIVRILKTRVGEVEARKIYGIITSKVNLLLNLPLALNGAISVSLIPEISRNFIKLDIRKIKRNIKASLLITLIISLPIMFIYMFFSKNIMYLLYPNAPRGAELLRLGSIAIIFSCITQNLSGILQGIGNSKTHLFSVMVAMILKFILNIVLVSNKYLLEKGAIISTLVADFVIFYIMFRKFWKTFKYLKIERLRARP